MANDVELGFGGWFKRLSEKERKALEHLIKGYRELEYKYNKALSDLVQAEHKNKELEEENRTLKAQKIAINNKRKELEEELNGFRTGKYITLKVNELYISTSLVKEKIEEIDKEEQELQNSISDEEREEYSDANISFALMDIEIRRSVLQDLLERSGEDETKRYI